MRRSMWPNSSCDSVSSRSNPSKITSTLRGMGVERTTSTAASADWAADSPEAAISSSARMNSPSPRTRKAAIAPHTPDLGTWESARLHGTRITCASIRRASAFTTVDFPMPGPPVTATLSRCSIIDCRRASS